MRIKSITRNLLTVSALCAVLIGAGCGAATSGGGSDLVDPGTSGAPVAALKAEGDWAMTMLPGGTVGAGMFPAKFTFDITATPNCTNDYVAMNTSLTGVSATAAASQTGTWSGAVATSGTVTIGSPEATLVLTASTTVNTGLNFQIVTSITVEATNLAAAINRNNFATLGAGHVKVRATSAAGVVTVNASADGATNLNGSEGNLITLAQAILPAGRFSWTAATLTGGLGTGNIVAFNKLYSTQGAAGGLCNQNGPSAYWSYFTGTGQALTSVVLSGDGSKVAFVENAAGGATLRILKWKSGEGVGAGYPVAPTTTLAAGQNWTTNCPAGNSCIRSIALNGAVQDTRSAPFYNYNTDVLYIGDNNGKLHKFTGVFNGTPAEVAVGWPITVNATAGTILSGPVFDGVSGNIFVGDSTGRLSFVREVGSSVGACGVGSTPCLGSVNLQIGTGGSIVDPPIVDGTTGRVFASNGPETSNNGMIMQASTALTGAVSFDVGGTSGPGASVMYSGAFDNTYINSASPAKTGHMYVCGKDNAAGGRPAIYQLSFNGTGVLTGVGTALVGLVSVGSGAGTQTCTPVTEVYNPNAVGGAKDWIFFATADNANIVNPIPAGTCRTNQEGCLISIDVTGNPTWPPTVVTNARALPPSVVGSASGIVVDNVADTVTSPQASSIYLTFIPNSTATATCNGTTGTGCALKLTQSALQ